MFNKVQSHKMLIVSHATHALMKKASEKSGHRLQQLTEALITKEINWLNDPVKIANYFKMCSEDK